MIDIFAGVAVSSTNVYKSLTTKASNDRCFYAVKPTGTLTGTLKRQVNILEESEYWKAVAAAAGTTQAEKEAANDTGWIDQSFLQGDATNASATFAISGTTTFTADMPQLKLRTRLVYTNATNTGNMFVYLQLTPA